VASNPYLEVIWNDAASNDGWVDTSDDTSPIKIISRGWLIKETPTYLVLAAAKHCAEESTTVGSTQTIPTGMIIKKRTLRISNAARKTRNKIHPQPNSEAVHREQG